jgi:hypothetical protein
MERQQTAGWVVSFHQQKLVGEDSIITAEMVQLRIRPIFVPYSMAMLHRVRPYWTEYVAI